MNRIAVCFIHEDAIDLFRGSNGSRFGGAETQVYLLANMLADNPEFDVVFLTERDVSDLAHNRIAFRSPEKPVSRGVPYLSRFVNAARAAYPYRDLEGGILLQTIAGPGTVQAWKTARRRGLKFVSRMSCDADIDASFHSEMAERYFEVIRDADGIIAQTAE